METSLRSNVYQYGFGISAGMAAMAAGAWLSWPSSVIPILKDGSQGVNLTTGQIATMVALMDFGNFLSPVPTSYMMDTIGRKPTLMISGLCCIVSSLLVMIHTNQWLIYAARVLAGISKGVTFAVVPIYLAEIANTQIRGALSTMFIGFLNIGMLYDYVIGPNTTYLGLNIWNFAVPLLFLTTILFFPESPYFLVMKKKNNAALKSLSRFGQVKIDGKRSNELDAEFSLIANKVEDDMKNKARFVDLVTSPSNRRALLIISLLAFFQRSSGISPTIAYSSTTMPKTGGGMSLHAYMILFSILLVLANYVAMPFVDKWGRKPLLLVSSLTTAFVTASVGCYYYLERNTTIDVENIRWVPYAGLLSFAVTYSIGIGFLPSTLVGELFPTNVKSYAGSVSAIILALVSFTVNKVFQEVGDVWGVHVMYAYFTIACLSCAAFVHFYVFETKGKTLKEIQDYLIQLDQRTKAVIV